MIDDEKFLEIIDSTPLVSIDLILEDNEGRVLLGKRVNRPAQGSWFVPGGIIHKSERFADAIQRVSLTELGSTILIDDTQFLGVFEHIYSDNCFCKEGVSTHYVVLAYKVNTKKDLEIIPDSQHSDIKWWSIPDLLNDPDVHKNTKIYFS